MSENAPLGEQLREDFLNNLTVSVTAVLLALLALGAFTISGRVDGGLSLALIIAVLLPYAYEERWPIEYAPLPAVVWTVSAALVSTGLFLGAYVLFRGFLSSELVEPAAFVLTAGLQYGTMVLYARVRNSA